MLRIPLCPDKGCIPVISIDVGVLALTMACEMPTSCNVIVISGHWMSPPYWNFLGVQTMIGLQKRVRELHYAFFNQFLPSYIGREGEHVSAWQKFYRWITVKFRSLCLMNSSPFESFLLNTRHNFRALRGGKESSLFYKKFGKLQIHQLYIFFSCQCTINLDVSVDVCVHFNLMLSQLASLTMDSDHRPCM